MEAENELTDEEKNRATDTIEEKKKLGGNGRLKRSGGRDE